MTHLSDYSFLQRATSLFYLLIWYFYRVWSLDRFKCVRISKFKQGELKGIVTLLLFFMIPFQLIYEITSCRVKYEEGFVKVFGHIFGKPETLWTQADRNLIIPTDYSLCIGFSLQTGTLLLLQCFWNYLANSVARANFMSSKEFKLYIVWTCMTIIIFPVLQFNFSRSIYDYTYKEVMPELVYGCGLFIIALLGVRSHYRFNKLLLTTKNSINSRFVSNKISYFQELNFVLTVALFFFSTSLIILCADGLTGRKTLNVHKFSSDFLICNTNVASIVVWVVVILIFHPKKPNESQQYQGQQQFVAPSNSNPSSSRRLSTMHQHEALVTTATMSTTSPMSYGNTSIQHHNNGSPPIETHHLSVVHSNATTLVSTSANHHHHHHHQQQQKQHPYQYDPSSQYCMHHQEIDLCCKSSDAPLSYISNESTISNTSREEHTSAPQPPPLARNPSAAGGAYHTHDTPTFTSRQPLVQDNEYRGGRKPSDDSLWLHQLPKGRWS